VYKDPLDSAMKWQQQLTPLNVERILRVVSRSDLGEIYMKSCAAQKRAPASSTSIVDTNQMACSEAVDAALSGRSGAKKDLCEKEVLWNE
jgi:hypothetical protein